MVNYDFYLFIFLLLVIFIYCLKHTTKDYHKSLNYRVLISNLDEDKVVYSREVLSFFQILVRYVWVFCNIKFCMCQSLVSLRRILSLLKNHVHVIYYPLNRSTV